MDFWQVTSTLVAVTIAGYEKFRPIGSGGFSTVYEARQPELNRRVAVKVLTLGSDQTFDRAAFEGECRAMGTVSEHPNIVTVYESGFSQDGLPYITMELYNETLLDRIKARGFLSLEEILPVGILMASALHRAHVERLLHRDIKPQNIFFSQYGEPFLGDFGIAALAHEQHAQRSFGLTFHYAAPEVLDGEMPQIESDIYSLGATIYTALAGHRPFARPGAKESHAVITNRILSEPPPPITAQRIPDNIERALLTLLAKHPNDRPRSALQVGELLRDLQSRLGFEMTPMRVAENDFDNDHTVSRNPVNGAPQVPSSTEDRTVAAVVNPPSAAKNLEDSLSGSVTIYRASERAKPTSDFATPERESNRTLIGITALIVLVALAAGGFFLLSNNDDPVPTVNEPTDSSTTTTTTLITVNPPAPADGLVIQEENGRVEVSWDEAENAVRYRVDFTAGLDESVVVDETETTADLPEDAALVCVEVVSVGESGRTAAPSEQACINAE